MNIKCEDAGCCTHSQAYFTITAVLISQCIGNNIGHLLSCGPKLYAIDLY